jgi:hypothetical protein
MQGYRSHTSGTSFLMPSCAASVYDCGMSMSSTFRGRAGEINSEIIVFLSSTC